MAQDFRLTHSTELTYNPKEVVTGESIRPHRNLKSTRGCSCLTPANILQILSVSQNPHGGNWSWPQRAPQQRQLQQSPQRQRQPLLSQLQQSPPKQRLVPPSQRRPLSQQRQRPAPLRRPKPQLQRSQLPRASNLTGLPAQKTSKRQSLLRVTRPFFLCALLGNFLHSVTLDR